MHATDSAVGHEAERAKQTTEQATISMKTTRAGRTSVVARLGTMNRGLSSVGIAAEKNSCKTLYNEG